MHQDRLHYCVTEMFRIRAGSMKTYHKMDGLMPFNSFSITFSLPNILKLTYLQKYLEIYECVHTFNEVFELSNI